MKLEDTNKIFCTFLTNLHPNPNFYSYDEVKLKRTVTYNLHNRPLTTKSKRNVRQTENLKPILQKLQEGIGNLFSFV